MGFSEFGRVMSVCALAIGQVAGNATAPAARRRTCLRGSFVIIFVRQNLVERQDYASRPAPNVSDRSIPYPQPYHSHGEGLRSILLIRILVDRGGTTAAD